MTTFCSSKRRRPIKSMKYRAIDLIIIWIVQSCIQAISFQNIIKNAPTRLCGMVVFVFAQRKGLIESRLQHYTQHNRNQNRNLSA